LTQLELVSIYVGTGSWHKPLGPWEFGSLHRGYISECEEELQLIINVKRPNTSSNAKPDISPLDVIVPVGQILKGFAKDTFEYARNPCKDGPCHALLEWFTGFPVALPYMLSLISFLLPFPLQGIMFLLKLLKGESLKGRRLIAARIVLTLCKFQFRVTVIFGGLYWHFTCPTVVEGKPSS